MIYKLKPYKDGFELVDILDSKEDDNNAAFLYATEEEFAMLDPNVILDRKGLIRIADRRRNK